MVAAVAVVAGIGAGLATAGNSNHGNAAGGKAASALSMAPAAVVPGGAGSGAVNGAGAGPGAGGAVAGGTEYSAIAACPAKPVQYALPGGGGTNQFGAGDSLFSAPVSFIVICRYSSTTLSLTGSDLLSGSAAQDLATSIDKASTTQHDDQAMCARPWVVELLPTRSGGQAMTPISIVSGVCLEGMATNGSAVRYVPWSEFAGSPPTSAGVLQPGSGTMSGSPLH